MWETELLRRVARAGLLIDLERPEAAAVELRALVTERPDQPELWALLAHALNTCGRSVEAVDAARRAVALAPTDPDALSALAVALLGAGRAQEAAGAAWQAVGLAPQSWEAHAIYGLACLRLPGREAQGRAALAEARRLAPELSTLHALMGALALQAGRGEEAEALFRGALGQEPIDSDAVLGLAVSHALQRRYRDAIVMLGTALRMEPGNETAHDALRLVGLIGVRLTAVPVLLATALGLLLTGAGFAVALELHVRLLLLLGLGAGTWIGARLLGWLSDADDQVYRALLAAVRRDASGRRELGSLLAVSAGALAVALAPSGAWRVLLPLAGAADLALVAWALRRS